MNVFHSSYQRLSLTPKLVVDGFNT